MHRTVYLKTTDTCNLNCSHCFTGGSSTPRYLWRVDETMKWIERFMAYVPENDHVHFEFHGGEPMLAPVEQLEQVCAFIRTFGSRISVGTTTNLVYKLDDLKWFFLLGLDGFATSWDPDIRFANEGQYLLWEKNLRDMVKARKAIGKQTSLHVSVSRRLTEMNQEDLIHFYAGLGVDKVMFDRITLDGNAKQHDTLFPSNQEINNWYLKMHEATQKLGARKWFFNAALEDVYAKFEKGMTACGTFCRDCEERIITINADGTIAGCPNGAHTEVFGGIGMDIPHLMRTGARVELMTQERVRNEKCFECPVFQYCGSDCHRLAWDGDICASPRELMKELAGLEAHRYPTKKVIPIFAK